MHKRMLECLPTPDKPTDLATSIQLLENMGKTEVFAFCGLGLAGQHKTLLSWLSSMRHGRGPQFGTGALGDFMTRARGCIANFARWPQGASGSSTDSPKFGKEAIKTIFTEVSAKAKDDSDIGITLVDVRPLQVFNFLLDDDDAKVVAAWTDQILAAAGLVATGTHGEVAPPAPKRRRVGKKGQDARGSVVGGYFEST